MNRTEQTPIASEFGQYSTANEIAARYTLTGKVAIVTGGNSGIGLETVKALAANGAEVVVGARDNGKSYTKLSTLNKVTFFPLDLADPESVDQFAANFLQSHQHLHILINNAGIFQIPQLLHDKRKAELQFGVNHLAHFQLTARLWPALKAANGARVVTLSSVGHRRMPINFDDINFEKTMYDPMVAYGQSKTANILFTVALDQIGSSFNIRAFAVHPGAIKTDIFRNMEAGEIADWEQKVDFFKTSQQGAATTIWCAVSPQLNNKGGVYCEDCNIAQLFPPDAAATYGVRSFAIDPVIARQLWCYSEEATGIHFPFL